MGRDGGRDDEETEGGTEDRQGTEKETAGEKESLLSPSREKTRDTRAD